MLRSALLSLLLATSSVSLAAAQSADSTIDWVQGGPYRLKVALFRNPSLTAPPTLVVVLHGDSPFGKPDYQDRFAASVAARYPNTVVAAILRPGYTDPAGHTSEGERGQTTGDNYSARNSDALAAAVTVLRDRFHASSVVLVGHSGGAALSANILGRHPKLVTAALLVSCPCDVVRWREHMFRKTGFAGFDGAIATLSPIDLVDSLSPTARIHLLVGERDDVTPPELTQAYAATARAHGRPVTATILPEAGHEILLTPQVVQAVRALLP